MRRTRPEIIGRGNDRGFLRRIVIGFDDETFDAIRHRAIAQKTSFAEQVRQLVEWGLEDVSQEQRP